MALSDTGVHLNTTDSAPKFHYTDWKNQTGIDYFTFNVQQVMDGGRSGHKVTFYMTEDQLRKMRDKASEALRSRDPLTEVQEAYRVAGQTFMEDPSPENFVALANACDPMMPGATDTDIIRVIKHNVVQDCLKAIKNERMQDNVDQSGVYWHNTALDQAFSAVEALLPQQQGKTLMEVAAEEESKEPVRWCVAKHEGGKYHVDVVGGYLSQGYDTYAEAAHAAVDRVKLNPAHEYVHWTCAPRPDATVVEEAISYNSDPHPVTC
jgi:hypothetical protein